MAISLYEEKFLTRHNGSYYGTTTVIERGVNITNVLIGSRELTTLVDRNDLCWTS